ncbi:MAG: hypothetical protein AAB214_10265 [Fibrobacterota bacterium]
MRLSSHLLAFLGAVTLFAGCSSEPPCPYYNASCKDAPGAGSPTAPVTADRNPGRYSTTDETPNGIVLSTSTGAVRSFVGSDSFKLAIGVGKRLYLLLPESDTSKPPRCVRIDRGDEGPSGNAGWPNEPLFSPDGRWLAYAGDFVAQSQTASFVREAVAGTGWRVPVVRSGDRATNPHWRKEGSDLWLYVTDVAGTASWNASTKTVSGGTYRARFLDSSLSSFAAATVNGVAIPGSFKGGISLDGKWVGTSYQPSVLFETESGKSTVLNSGIQQCNPSMNPFASGANTDYMMILGFGGAIPVPTLTGNINEGQHEHLWIWSKDDKAVWGAALPNVAPHATTEVPGVSYSEWQRPEWSTHPDFATALAKRSGTPDGEGYDLIMVKLGASSGELAAHNRTTMLERGPVLRLATGNFYSSDWSHLWVGK